jgi:Zn-finger nucleic acid-binding protein
MEAQTLNCPNCGAAISSDSPLCRYCESKLATVACASCFGMMFIGSRHCPHCGAAATAAKPADLSVLKCPACRIDMVAINLGGSAMRECEKCGGLWVDVAAFEEICADREQQSAVLGTAITAQQHPRNLSRDPITVRYLRCPQCSQLMNRMNFARCSGVIVDVCRGHGTWFDVSELREIVEFIRAGGLDLSRQKEKREIKFEREQMGQERLVVTRITFSGSSNSDDDRLLGLSAAGGLLKFLLE